MAKRQQTMKRDKVKRKAEQRANAAEKLRRRDAKANKTAQAKPATKRATPKKGGA
jgi:hypothetical protein